MRSVLTKSLALLDAAGHWLAPLGLRLLLGWEFLESGLVKYDGENWFDDVRSRFFFPFDVLPTAWSWQMATWFEIVGGIALVLGIGTRFFAASLAVLTVVAIGAVHWPEMWTGFGDLLKGYALTDGGYGNFKLPVIFLAMLLPLILSGPGRLSLDAWMRRRVTRTENE
ncbi:MAG: DoxX family protein [Sterolibacteriaceae bacterium MAG5]|nr:DoxX family protein [Candidatus Nitricoxidireducens bremensis]